MADSIDKFEDFMAAIGSASPDMGAIKAAIQSHPDWLSDEDKLKSFFPERSKNHKGLESLGLEDTKGLKNVMLAAAELNKETNEDGSKKFSDEQLKKLVEFKNPETDETAFECLENNIRIAEKKLRLPSIQERETLSGKISDNLDSMNETMAAFRDVGLINEQNQSPLTISANEADGNVLTVNAPEETIAVGGTANAQPLTVQATPQPQQPEQENEAIGEEPGEEDKGHKPGKFSPVKEGDIIDYMFDEWFLASVNWGGEKFWGMLDRIVEGNDSSPSESSSARATRAPAAPAPAPRAPAPGAPTPGTPTPGAPTPTTDHTSTAGYQTPIAFMDAGNGFPQELAVQMWGQEILPKLESKQQAIMSNIGKPADQWKLPAGVVIPHAQREILNKMSPKQLQATFKNTQQAMMMTTLIATRAATLQYMQEHKGENIDFNSKAVKDEIRAGAENWAKTITQQAQGSNDANYFKKLDKSLDKLEGHLRDYHTASKPKDKQKATEKVEGFNLTKELFQDKAPVTLQEEAKRPVVSSPNDLQAVQNEKQAVTEQIKHNNDRKSVLQRFKENGNKFVRQATRSVTSVFKKNSKVNG